MQQAITAFRFNAASHVYTDLETGAALQHITGMLERTGWIDDTWMTEESSERGSAVHALTAEYDLGALDPTTCISRHRGYLLGHVACMQRLRPTWSAIEVPYVHPTWRYGGRPDRVGMVLRRRVILEVKSGQPAQPREPGGPTAHTLQTALQALLVAVNDPLPAEQWVRYCLYLTPKGRYKLEEHRDHGADFTEARRIILACTK